MTALPSWPALTRLHRESKEVYLQLFVDGTADATLGLARERVAGEYGCRTWQELRDVVSRAQEGRPGEPAAERLQFLDDAGTKDNPHSGYTLYEHLFGTWDLLAEWGNPDHVAAAGLFHSIYGTQVYKITSVPLARRAEVAGCIGEPAEELAYIFCVTERALFQQIGRSNPRLEDAVHKQTISLTSDQLRELIEIEVANHVEQIYPERVNPQVVTGLRRMLTGGEHLLSEGARVALDDLIVRCEHRLAAKNAG